MKEELFNLCHASARNVIEHIFGMLKYRFQILHLAPEYSMDIQAHIPAALAAIHNFIHGHKVDDEVVWVVMILVKQVWMMVKMSSIQAGMKKSHPREETILLVLCGLTVRGSLQEGWWQDK